MTIQTDKYLIWKERVFYLEAIEMIIKKRLDKGEISKRKYNEIQKILNKEWVKNWDYYPNKNESIDKAFKLNFKNT